MKGFDKIAAELTALADLSDSDIDTSDIPERGDWTDAVRGKFLRKGSQSRELAPVKRMSDEQKGEIRELLQRGLSRYQIADQVGVTPGQVSAVRAWVTMRRELPEPAGAEGDEIVEAVETTFGLEQDLQEALRRNVAQLEPGLTITDGDKERRVKSGGRIDILAEGPRRRDGCDRAQGRRADRDAIGQLLAYIGHLLDEAESVRGILVAAEFAPRAIAASRAAPNIRLVRYGIQFSFSPIGSRTA